MIHGKDKKDSFNSDDDASFSIADDGKDDDGPNIQMGDYQQP